MNEIIVGPETCRGVREKQPRNVTPSNCNEVGVNWKRVDWGVIVKGTPEGCVT